MQDASCLSQRERESHASLSATKPPGLLLKLGASPLNLFNPREHLPEHALLALEWLHAYNHIC